MQGSYRITGAQRELYRQEAEKGEANIKEKKHDLEKQVAFIPQDYYAIREARAKVSEESRKIETENEEELISMFRSALERKDQFLAAAIAQQASRVGHLNELIADFGEEGNNQFDQNGFNGFINKNFIGKLGMNRQWAYALQNDYSDTAQQIGHWTFSQAVGMKNGQYVQRTLEQQRERMTGEAGKKNFEGRMRDNNRLGGWYTEYAGPSGRQSVLNEFGLMEIETHFKNLPELIRRNRFNDNSLVNLWTDENKRLLSELKRTRIKPADYAQFDEFMRSVELRLGETSEGVRPSQMLAPHRRLKQSIGARFA